MIPGLNNRQKAYVADCLKIAGSAQLAVLGIKHVYDQGSIGLPLLVASLLIWAILVLLGLELLRDDEGE